MITDKCKHYWEEDHRQGANHGGYCCRKCGATSFNPWAKKKGKK